VGTYTALIVGAGSMGRAWGQNLRDCENVEVVGWVDLRPDVAAQAAEELGLRGVHTGPDLEKAIAEARPDFVVDVTTPESHRDVTVQALAAGMPVLGEKPMADSMAHAREMVAAAERAGTLYMVSQSRRYDANLLALRRLIVEHIGLPGILNSDFYVGAHFGGFRDEMDSPLLLDMAIHTLDAARYLCGADPVAVYCDEFNPPWSWYRGHACATAIFEMTGALRYTYRGSWCSEGRHTSWEGEWHAVGPHGSATWDGRGAPVAEVVVARDGFVSRTQTRVGEVQAGVPGGIAGSLRDFLHALETGATPMGECHDNIKSLAMVFGAIESAATGRRVPVPLA
jgi:predicted dehydrogenase